jgi:isopentenyldiphosphate isomerase
VPASELVDIVDENDLVAGTTTVGECLERGLLHRAVAVLVIRSSGKYLLQRRSMKDRWQPGLWTISSTGHVKKGEQYEVAAKRELEEELGLTAQLDRVRKYLLPPLHAGGLTEWEWVTLFVAHTDAPCTIDPLELDSVEEFDGDRLHTLLAGGRVTPDTVVILNDYLEVSGKK